jgi:hypothetical protein
MPLPPDSSPPSARIAVAGGAGTDAAGQATPGGAVVNTGTAARARAGTAPPATPVPEVGGPSGPEPTRFGDWERAGRCIDF